MKASEFLFTTYKEAPADAEISSHKLLLRSGMIQRLTSGLYTWSPLGLRSLTKVAQVVREEMNRSGALEISMPMVQPAELWQESNRWQDYGPELLRLVDRHQRDYCLGPTHEEVITDFARRSVKSYKQLPLNLYQIQTKFRDEIRPRFGLMRAREFVMKDAYSFHTNADSLDETYQAMKQAYVRAFSRLGLNFKVVSADSGAIGGDTSHEFQALADIGEDQVAFSTNSDYAANIELAEAVCLQTAAPEPQQALTLINTPNTKTIEALVTQYDIPIEKTIKTLIVDASDVCDHEVIALIIRGDHELNTIKAEQLPEVAKPLTLADPEKIQTIIGASPGSLGPVNLPIPYVVDRSAAVISDFSAGANINDQHYTGINWGRDVVLGPIADLRNVVNGDPCPDGNGTLEIKHGIEIGHIFKLGDKYSKKMQFEMTMEDGQQRALLMGCYGIGVSRIVAAAIEQNQDEQGIIWPRACAPFELAIVEINPKQDPSVQHHARQWYDQLKAAGWDVLLDDRNERPGLKFADLELIGIPHRLVVSTKLIEQGAIEYTCRRTQETLILPIDTVKTHLAQLED